MANKSVLDFTTITSALPTDVLYAIRGVGAGRDKNITIANILNSIASQVKVTSDGSFNPLELWYGATRKIYATPTGDFYVGSAQFTSTGHLLTGNAVVSGILTASTSIATPALAAISGTLMLNSPTQIIGGLTSITISATTISAISTNLTLVGALAITGTLGISDNVTVATGKRLSAESVWLGTSVYVALGSNPLTLTWDGSSANPAVKSNGGLASTYDMSVGRNLTVVGTSTLGGDTAVSGMIKGVGLSGGHALISVSSTTLGVDLPVLDVEFVELNYTADGLEYRIGSILKPSYDGAMMTIAMTSNSTLLTTSTLTFACYNAGIPGTNAIIKWGKQKTTYTGVAIAVTGHGFAQLRYSSADTAWILLG